MIKSVSVMIAVVLGVSVFAVDALKMKDGKVTIEAEKGKISGKMKVVDDQKASGGKAVVSAKGGVLEYEFTVDEAGDYVIWGRVIGVKGNQDSFFVVINEGPQLIWDTNAKKYTWKPVKGRNKPAKHKLKKGKNTLKIKCREPNATIDKIFVAKPGVKPPKK